MARRVRRVWFAVLGETSDLSWMDDSTDQGGPQALRKVQASRHGICGQNFLGPKAKQKSSRGGLSGGWARKRRVPGVDQAQDYLG